MMVQQRGLVSQEGLKTLHTSFTESSGFTITARIQRTFQVECSCMECPYVQNITKQDIITHLVHSPYHGPTAGSAACFGNSEFFCTTNCDYFIKVSSPNPWKPWHTNPPRSQKQLKVFNREGCQDQMVLPVGFVLFKLHNTRETAFIHLISIFQWFFHIYKIMHSSQAFSLHGHQNVGHKRQ